MQYTNWNDYIRTDVEHIVAPRTEDEVAQVVRAALAAGRHVKAIGSGHSFNHLGMCEDVLLDVSRLDGFEVVDPQRGLVAVGGGMTLTCLIEKLEAVGLALANQGAWTAQTVAGVVSTATHGSSGKYRETLIGSVREIHLIDGKGNPRVMADAQLNMLTLGFFGVITKVVIQCQPLRTLRQVNQLMDGKQAIERIDMELSEHDFVDLRWVGHLDRILVRRWDIVPGVPSRRDRYRHFREGVKLGGLNGVLSVVRLSKLPGDLLVRGLGWSYLRFGEGHPHRANWHAALTFNSLRVAAPHEEREFAIPMDRAKACLHALRQEMLGDPSSTSLEIQVRFSPGVPVRLAPNHGCDTCWFNLNMLASSLTGDLVERLSGIAHAHGARPHWGKSISGNSPPLTQLYGADLQAWERQRHEHDPDGLFLNNWYHQYIDLAPRSLPESAEQPLTPETLKLFRRLRRTPARKRPLLSTPRRHLTGIMNDFRDTLDQAIGKISAALPKTEN